MIAAEVAVGMESILALRSSPPPPTERPRRRGAGRRWCLYGGEERAGTGPQSMTRDARPAYL
jgi:hypothetical protein